MALLVVLEAMTPAERVTFILHDVFHYPFAEIGAIVGRSPEACRKLASSARRRVDRHRGPPTPPAEQASLVAASNGPGRRRTSAALVELLDPDATVVADGGGLANAALRPITGGRAVRPLPLDLAAGTERTSTIVGTTVNGRPGLAGQTTARPCWSSPSGSRAAASATSGPSATPTSSGPGPRSERGRRRPWRHAADRSNLTSGTAGSVSRWRRPVVSCSMPTTHRAMPGTRRAAVTWDRGLPYYRAEVGPWQGVAWMAPEPVERGLGGCGRADGDGVGVADGQPAQPADRLRATPGARADGWRRAGRAAELGGDAARLHHARREDGGLPEPGRRVRLRAARPGPRARRGPGARLRRPLLGVPALRSTHRRLRRARRDVRHRARQLPRRRRRLDRRRS